MADCKAYMETTELERAEKALASIRLVTILCEYKNRVTQYSSELLLASVEPPGHSPLPSCVFSPLFPFRGFFFKPFCGQRSTFPPCKTVDVTSTLIYPSYFFRLFFSFVTQELEAPSA